MRICRILAGLGLLLLATCRREAMPPDTPETDAMELIAGSFTDFRSAEQRPPRDWQELMGGTERGFSIDQLAPQSLPSVRYELLSPPLEVEDSTRGKLSVVAVTRKAMREPLRLKGVRPGTRISDPGRYMIFEAPDGRSYQPAWFPETEIQAMWSKVGRPLPVPDNEPERPWLRERRKADLGVLAYFAAVIAGFWLILRWARRVRKSMPEI